MRLITDNTALMIIDVQEGLDDPIHGTRNNPDAETQMARLLVEWRTHGRPIFHVQHMSTNPSSTLRPGQPGNAIKRVVAPQGDELIIRKQMNNAFIGTDLEARLRDEGVEAVVLVGLTTGHCVSATARMASDLGFTTYVVADATACFDHIGYDGKHYPAETIHAVSLVSLQDEFATIVTTGQLIGTQLGKDH
jgi:nicotinamidase-related amidase